jgi:hemerythrin superfamily protein
MRSIADQSTAQLGGPMSILVRQRADHVELDRLIQQLSGESGEAYERTFAKLNRLVFSHAFAEEAVLWPLLRRLFPEGEQLTLQVEQEHQEVNELVVALDEHRQGPDRERLQTRLFEVLREDVRDEEDELLPRLQDRLDAQQLRRVGWQWEVVRRTAPTRPHPVVARRPPGNVVAALPLSVIDRTRDRVDMAARVAPDRFSGPLRRTSQALAKVSHTVERTPAMRRGERASTARDPEGL